MTIPESLVGVLRQVLKTTNLHSFVALAGGDICSAAYFEAEAKAWVVKWGPTSSHHDLIRAEIQGLELLEAGGAPLPGGRQLITAEGYTGILMDFVPAVAPTERHWRNFGQILAALHQHSAPAFGADHGNYIGTIYQTNDWSEDLGGFLREHRFEPLLKKAAGNLDGSTISELHEVIAGLDELLPAELPALIHGDLWSGNVLFAGSDEVYLIDPSAHFGCREQDLAMLDLFGKLREDFVASYHTKYPLYPGWRERISLWKLIPLLVHVVLFGQGYEGAIRTELKKLKIF